MIEIVVYGTPKAQPRPRAFAVKGSARVYNPSTAEGWKSEIAAACANHPQRSNPIEGPIKLTLSFIMPRPKSHYRTGKYAGKLKPTAPRWHTAKPDLDNLEKAVVDCLTTLGFWRDDAQVCETNSTKTYGHINDRYGIDRFGCLIRIEEL